NLSLVYANPVEGDRFYVKSENLENAKLFNFSGLCVFSGSIGKDGLFIGDLPKGIYLLNIGKRSEKVILK
ncbi:MAG: T9SS type A sorting domain-containing protein, partial [Cytophagales bacterium]|nr:T9SS type A sorting domain-containing protein [Cytophagales bacterium]